MVFTHQRLRICCARAASVASGCAGQPSEIHAPVSQKLSAQYSRHRRVRRSRSRAARSFLRHSADQPSSPTLRSLRRTCSQERRLGLPKRHQTKWNNSWSQIRFSSEGFSRSSVSRMIRRCGRKLAAWTGVPWLGERRPPLTRKSSSKRTRIRKGFRTEARPCGHRLRHHRRLHCESW